MGFKFIHASDIHLDSPLRGLERYEGAPAEEIRGATRTALVNLVDLAISEEAHFVVLAGDVFEGGWKDYNTALFFAKQMSRLREADVLAFLISGNHDAASQLNKNLRLPDNVRTFSARKAQSVAVDTVDVVIHGRGFPARSVTDDLLPSYPAPVDGALNIGLLHTSIEGRKGHEPYAPCSLDELRNKGYQYWALGHVHQYEVVSEDPWVVFSGTTQGRHVNEIGPKGCVLVTVEDGTIQMVEQARLDAVEWTVCTVDVSESATGEDAVDRAVEGLRETAAASDGAGILATRLQLVGSCAAHTHLLLHSERWTSELRLAANDLSSSGLWLEKVLFKTQPPDILRDEDEDFIKSILKLADAAVPTLLDAISADIAHLSSKIPAECKSGAGCIDLEAHATSSETIAAARELLVARLLSRGTS